MALLSTSTTRPAWTAASSRLRQPSEHLAGRRATVGEDASRSRPCTSGRVPTHGVAARSPPWLPSQGRLHLLACGGQVQAARRHHHPVCAAARHLLRRGHKRLARAAALPACRGASGHGTRGCGSKQAQAPAQMLAGRVQGHRQARRPAGPGQQPPPPRAGAVEGPLTWAGSAGGGRQPCGSAAASSGRPQRWGPPTQERPRWELAPPLPH